MSEQELVMKNMGLVGCQAKHFPTNSICDREDYIQTGVVALIRAVRGRDPTKGKLSTFAWPIIYREINSKQFQKFNKKPARYHNIEIDSPTELWEIMPENLSPQEKMCVQMKYDGYSVRDIAKQMKIKCTEVKIILEDVWRKIEEANNE